MVTTSITKEAKVFPVPDTELNNTDVIENNSKDPQITYKDPSVASIKLLSLVKMDNNKRGCIKFNKVSANVVTKHKTTIFFIKVISSLLLPCPIKLLTKVLVAELNPISGIIKIM